MVALVVAALALGALTAAVGTGLGNSAVADRYIEAVRRAQSRLDRVGVSEPLVPGEHSGDDGGGFSWRVRIAPPLVHAPVPGATQPLPALYDVEVILLWSNGGSRRSVSIRSQRLGPPARGNG